MGCSDDEHIVMLPMMAHGHLIPFLGFAKQIQQRTGFTITIANTPLNINYLQSTTATTNSSKIHLAELPFCSTHHGLPPNTENTENLSLDRIVDLLHASKSLKTPFYNLLLDITQKQGKPPLCIITDTFFGWAVDVAKSAGTVNVTFSTGGAYGTLAYMSLWLTLPHRNRNPDCDEFYLPGFPDRCRFHITQLHRFLRNADGTDSWSRFMQPQISESLESYGMLCNTVEEVESQALEWLRNFVKIPVWSIGPLLPPALLNNSSSNDYKQHSSKVPGISAEKCLEWLDLQDADSVLYVSFGSQNTISASQMMGLAIGLEESKVPFIWVIRPPIGFDLKGGFRSEWLPEGYEERIAITKQGLLVKNWAPQLDILSHKSTGAFLSHCGWNSVMESLSQGVPIIGWPMAAEQGYNSKMLVEEMGVAVELTRGVQTSVEGKDVKRVVELVLDKRGKGREMKENAIKIAKQIKASVMEKGGGGGGEGTGSSFKSLNDFVTSLIRRRETTITSDVK
ncbi:hypothetical protein ACOSP7_007004 [Xanthoceras sorbifolium]|uniref:Glycosyltransferase n=1 Tax=Xanthoceras sorbifolium TaxID=99658 RepID=A0ABQ8IA75_9ROSI|nr:hypothetical protein JRO89_XS03G0130700 [Xanthoceras sorbifolium]